MTVRRVGRKKKKKKNLSPGDEKPAEAPGRRTQSVLTSAEE